VGSAVNFIAEPRIAASAGFPFALLVSAGLCGFSMVIAMILSCLDKVGERTGAVKKVRRMGEREGGCLVLFGV
jgi:hypothetical protein